MMYKLLIVEDDRQAARMLRMYLETEGFEIMVAHDGPTAWDLFEQKSFHLLVVDVMLPGFDGLELCERVRKTSVVPIILLTARDQPIDKAVGLGVGADDYLSKPYSPIELIARIKAMLRRAYQFREPPREELLGGPRLILNATRHQVSLDGELVNLTPLEYKLLSVLMASPGWAFTRSHLLEKVWGYDDSSGEENVTVHVNNLRSKLGVDGHQLIRTIRAVGYAYDESGS